MSKFANIRTREYFHFYNVLKLLFNQKLLCFGSIFFEYVLQIYRIAISNRAQHAAKHTCVTAKQTCVQMYSPKTIGRLITQTAFPCCKSRIKTITITAQGK